jgi:hypothetical protein
MERFPPPPAPDGYVHRPELVSDLGCNGADPDAPPNPEVPKFLDEMRARAREMGWL